MKRIEVMVLLLGMGWLGQSALAAEPTKLAFDTYSGYFVSNQFEPDAAESFVVITDQEQFDKVFGVAFVMGDKSHRLPKDAFKTLMVVTAIKRGNAVVQYKVEGVTNRDGVVELKYTTTSEKSDTATFACPLILSIPKGGYKAIQFVENGKPVKKADVGKIVANSPAAEDIHPMPNRTISLNGDKGGMLAVVDGQPRLVNSRSALTEWTLQETDKGWTIQGRPSREINEPRFLSIDEEGKVTLVAKAGDGVYWKLTRKGDRMVSFDATIQASGGKFDGWYLGFSDEQEQVEKERSKYEAYRPELSEKPVPRTKLHIFVDGP